MSQLITSDENKSFLEAQINAITRAVLLIKDVESVTFDDVLSRLSSAEKKAVFVCGFVELERDQDYKRQLKEYLIKEEFLYVDGENISLTEKGRERANNKLPNVIEENFDR